MNYQQEAALVKDKRVQAITSHNTTEENRKLAC